MALSDLGRYQCLIWPEGHDDQLTGSQVATVVAAYIQEFFINPQSIIVNINVSLTLDCVTGYSAPPAHAYWQKDGHPFGDGRQLTVTFGSMEDGGAVQLTMQLEVDVAQRKHSGQYACVAVNPLSGDVIVSRTASVDVYEPPSIPYISDWWPSELLLAEGLSYLIDCPMDGWPVPVISWFKDVVSLANETHYRVLQNGTLAIDEVRRSDAGRYVCVGQNSNGIVGSPAINVTVAYLEPQFLEEPKDTVTFAGKSVTLTCRPPNSFPPANVTWYKNGEPVTEADDQFPIRVLATGGLNFASAQFEDAGVYYCLAWNAYSADLSRNSQKAQLTINGAAQVIEPPVGGQVIVMGGLLTLRCRVEGQPTPSVTWVKDNRTLIDDGVKVILSDAGQEMMVSSINKLDEGNYQCLASNLYGSARSSPVYVTVIVPPEVLFWMNDVTSVVGGNAFMKCQFYASPPATVTWFKGNNSIGQLSRSKYRLQDTGLLVQNLTQNDEGIYRCQGRNAGGNRTMSASLTVQVPPMMVSFLPNRTVNYSQLVVLFCEATGKPIPTISWKFNNDPLLPIGSNLDQTNKTLIIRSVGLQHSGKYSCLAENVLGVVQQSSYLFVQAKPVVDSIDGLDTIVQGRDLTLTCNVSAGDPQPKVTWDVDGMLLVPSGDGRIFLPDPLTLQVKFVTGADRGRYRCTASNTAGFDSRAVDVSIVVVPLPPILNFVIATSRTSINVTWSPVTQPPSSDVTYYVIRYQVENSSSFKLLKDDISAEATWYEVDGLKAATPYLVQVASRNEAGSGSYSSTLGTQTWASAPGRPRNLQSIWQNSSSVRLQWEVPQERNGELDQYQLQYRRSYPDEEYQSIDIRRPSIPLQTLSVTGLRSFTTYAVRVRAANAANGSLLWGDFTDSIYVTTDVTAPVTSPANVCVVVNSSRSVTVTWQSLTADPKNGPVTGYLIGWTRPDTESYKEYRVRSVNISLVIGGLSPWVIYGARLAAYNSAGLGPYSSTSYVRTLPEAPKGPPVNVQARPLSATSLSVTWQPIVADERCSEIAGYLVWYQAADDIRSLQTDKTSVNISNLKPSTTYSIRVQGFTTQVFNGFGPLSQSAAEATTFDDPLTSAFVTDMNITIGPDWLSIRWSRPSRPFDLAQIQGYRVVCYELTNQTENTSRELISSSDLPFDATQLRLVGLRPATTHNVSLMLKVNGFLVTMVSKIVTTVPLEATSRQMALTTGSNRIFLNATENDGSSASTLLFLPTADSSRGTGPGLSPAEVVATTVAATLGGLVLIGVVVGAIVWSCRLAVEGRKGGRAPGKRERLFCFHPYFVGGSKKENRSNSSSFSAGGNGPLRPPYEDNFGSGFSSTTKTSHLPYFQHPMSPTAGDDPDNGRNHPTVAGAEELRDISVDDEYSRSNEAVQHLPSAVSNMQGLGAMSSDWMPGESLQQFHYHQSATPPLHGNRSGHPNDPELTLL